MTSDDGKKLDGKRGTLTDADISSQRVSRRSLLGTLGIGAGVAVASVVGATPAEAQRRSDGAGWGKGCAPPCSDADSGYGSDPGGRGRCRIRRGCTDGD